MDIAMCFAFRQHKAVAGVFRCNDDDDNGNSYVFVLLKENQDNRCEQS
jgi:hypothetical protein